MRYTRAVAAGLPATLLSLVMLSGCGGAEARLDAHMQKGREYFAEENYEKARVELRNALQLAPENAEARFMNARVAEKLGNIADAARLYQSAIDSNSDYVEARAALGRMYVFGGAPERALEVIGPGLEKHPEDPDLLTVRGAARVQQKDRKGALEDAEKAVKLAPDNENAAALLASLYRQAGESARALDLVKTTLERVPESIDLHQVLAALYVGMGDTQLAEEQLRKVVELKPKELSYRQQLAMSYIRTGKLDEAEQALRDTVEALPGNSGAKLAYTDFLAVHRTRERAVEQLQQFIAREPKNYDLQFGLGALHLRNRHPEEALAIYKRILVANPEGVHGLSARNRIAAIHVGERRFDEASKLIAEVLKENPRDNDALILRGNIALERNDPASAISDLRAVLRDQPSSVGLLRTLARAHVANGEPALAEETLRNALDAARGDVSVRVELGQLLSRSGRAEQAVTLLEEAVKSAPVNVAAREALVRAYLGANDLDAARRAVEDLKLTAPELAAGPYLAGVIAHSQGRLDDASRELGKALELQPNAMDVLMALTRLDVERGRTPAAIARLEATAAADAKNPIVLNMLGEVYVSTKTPAKAIEPLTQALKLAPKWWVPHRNLAIARLTSGDEAGAIATYEAGVRATDYQPTLIADLAALYERLNRADDAIRQYEELHKRNPRLDLAANNLAMLLITYRNDQASLDRARDLSAAFATSSVGAFLDTHGWVRFKRGEINQALPTLERAAAQSPDSKVVRFHLGMAQMKAGEREKAIVNLEKALDGGAKFVGAEEARSTLAQLKGSGGAG